jgi:hypothetical protein
MTERRFVRCPCCGRPGELRRFEQAPYHVDASVCQYGGKGSFNWVKNLAADAKEWIIVRRAARLAGKLEG